MTAARKRFTSSAWSPDRVGAGSTGGRFVGLRQLFFFMFMLLPLLLLGTSSAVYADPFGAFSCSVLVAACTVVSAAAVAFAAGSE